MTRTKAFRESAGLDGKVMFAIALGLWVGLNVLALDAIMRWTLLHVVRRVKRIRMVYELFDTTVAARRRVDPRQVAIRTWAVGQLERSEDRKAVMFRLSWAEACERLAVWCFVAAVAVSPLVSRHPIWSIMGVVCLVTVLPLLFLVATIDQVRTAQERWKSSKLRFG